MKWGKVIPQIGRRGAGKGGHIVVQGARLGTGDLILGFPSFSRRSNGGFVKFSPGSVMDFDSLKCNPGLFLFSLLYGFFCTGVQGCWEGGIWRVGAGEILQTHKKNQMLFVIVLFLQRCHNQ